MVVLLAGLQGAGKTTTAGKLARWLIEQKKRVLLVSTDIRRPAAVLQLQRLAEQVGAEFFPPDGKQRPPTSRARRSTRRARASTTCSSSTPPAACTSTPSSWRR